MGECCARPNSKYMDSILGEDFPVLDHGFVRVVDYMGNDAAIVQAARVSYGSGTKATSDDRNLIRYLMRRWHTSPFEMCEIKLHVKLPVFVARQWIRHRTASVNEYSARYSILDREFYFPKIEHVASQSKMNNQGRGDALDGEAARRVLDILRHDAAQAYASYEHMIHAPDDGGLGLARELARINLPANIYTQWYWKTDLHNLLHFMRLRSDPHSQLEIRAYTDPISTILHGWVPIVAEAAEDYIFGGCTMSRMEMQMIRGLIYKTGNMPRIDEIEAQGRNIGMTNREVSDLKHKLNMRG